MRLFHGIDLPQDVKSLIHSYLLPLQTSSKGWEHPHDYHQTLLFIGESDFDQCEEIKRRLSKIEFHPFYLTLGEFRFFPRRILYFNFHYSEDLLKLKEMIDTAYPEWSKRETRKFVPHVTVKRWQRYEFDELKAGLSKIQMEPKQISVNELCLFYSQKDELNRKYHVLAKKVFNS